MIATLIQCPKCKTPLLEERIFNQPDLTPCPRCGDPLSVEVFPAYFRRNSPSQDGETSLIEGESTCFFHIAKKAVTPCQGCGRFLCALCDCDLNGQHYCPVCLEAGKSKGKIKNLENIRMRWDGIALALAVYPVATIIFWVFSIITAPIALFIAIRHWNAPRSIFHRTRIRYVLAIVISTLEILAWATGIYLLTRNTGRG
jgi:hypothetical protein